MKRTLGKPFFILLSLCLFCTGAVGANDFTYTITPSKKEPYLYEPLLLTVDLNQTDPSKVLLFQFTIKKDRRYRIKPLFAKHDDTLHHTKHHNRYVIYPLQTGEIEVHFLLVKRVTNDEKVRYFSSGDRDDFKKLETIDFPIEIPPVKLHVKPLPKHTQLVGDYHLAYHVDSHHSTAHSPIAMRVTLQGRGYPPYHLQILPKSSDYTLFSETPEIKTTSTNKGFIVTANYLFALSAKKSFTLPAIVLHGFNPQTEKPYRLTIPSQSFTVDAVNQERLLDKTDTPAPLQNPFAWVKSLWGYLVVFLAGYFTASLLKWQKKEQPRKADPLVEKITHANDAKHLLQILMAQDASRFSSPISQLEEALYHNTKINLQEIKKEAIGLL